MLNMIWVRIKEYRAIIPVFISMTVMSVALIYVFGVGFGQEYKPPVALVNEDGSYESGQIVDQMMAEKAYEIALLDYDTAVNELKSGAVIAVIRIPENYSQDYYEGKGIIDFIKTATVIEHTALEMTLRSVVDRTFGNELFLDGVSPAYQMLQLDMNRENLNETINDLYRDRPMIHVEAKTYESDAANYYDSLKQSFMGFIIFFSLFTMVFGVGSIVDNKHTRVWHRQIVSPINGTMILGSMLAVGFVVGFLQIGTMMFSAKYIFDIDLGDSMIALMLVIGTYILTALCMGLMISGFVKTEQQLSAVSPMIIVSTSMLGGCMWPLEMVTNPIIRNLSILTPQRWAMQGLQQVIIYRGDVSNVMEPIGYSLILALIFFVISIIPYRKTA